MATERTKLKIPAVIKTQTSQIKSFAARKKRYVGGVLSVSQNMGYERNGGIRE
jgi:hypothetical protein